MTVKRASVNESARVRNSSDPNKINEFLFYGKLKEIETDQESTGSSEDMESPRSVVTKTRKWPAAAHKNMNGYVHSQILRIREEDSHIREDVVESLSIGTADDSHRYVFIFSDRPVLPASPLSGKTIKSVH